MIFRNNPKCFTPIIIDHTGHAEVDKCYEFYRFLDPLPSRRKNCLIVSNNRLLAYLKAIIMQQKELLTDIFLFVCECNLKCNILLDEINPSMTI